MKPFAHVSDQNFEKKKKMYLGIQTSHAEDRCKWVDNIETGFNKLVCMGMEWILLARLRTSDGLNGYRNRIQGVIKYIDFLHR